MFGVNTSKAVKAIKAFSFIDADRKSIFYYIRRDWMLYALLVIPMVFLYLFFYRPMYGLQLAFKEYSLSSTISASPWVGLDVFKEVFSMREFPLILRNTLGLSLLDLVVGFPAPIILAILLNEITSNWFKKTSQTLLYLPHFLSWVIIASLMYQLFAPESGLVNILVRSMGGKTIPFLTNNVDWVFTYVIVGVWQTVGWGTIIYLAAISSINSELYEAAVVDGAGKLRKIWHVTLPGIKPTVIVLLIINLGRIMGSSFERSYNMMNPMVMDVANVISIFVYDMGLKALRFNVATAVGLFQSVIGFILVLITNYIANRAGEQGIT
jgi:putative aldouronate transport system permease protein